VTNNFTWLDVLVLVAYLGGVTALGMYFGRKQRNATDYFVASHSIPWWALMLSIVATETSALTFISTPGLAYGSTAGTGNLGFLQIVAGYIIGRIVVASVLLPRYFKGRMVTAYALLEQRFGIETRRFTSIVFMVTRGLADSVRVFATAIPIALIITPTVQNKAFVMPSAILILGALTVLYTYKGGMKAVVWTELLQASVYLLGALSAIVILGLSVDGGWSSIFSQVAAADKLQVIDTYVGLDRAHTIWAGLIGGAFLAMASHGTDQLIVQRLLSAKNLRDGQKAIIGSGIVVFIQFALFLFIGLGLWAFYQGRLFPATDQIFPTFIIDRMPPGLVGLIIAAVVAATMSTHSGAINSLAAATTHDIYLPLTKRAADAPETLKMGKLFALIWGTVLTLGALLFPQESNTPVVVVALGIASFTYGGLLGGFFLGVFWARANQRDAIIGMSVGIAAMSFVVFARQLGSWFPVLADPLAPFASIAWPWYVLIGTSITMTTGILSSLTHPSPAPVAQPSGASS
jgi:SSS family solute:Na+ symporter